MRRQKPPDILASIPACPIYCTDCGSLRTDGGLGLHVMGLVLVGKENLKLEKF